VRASTLRTGSAYEESERRVDRVGAGLVERVKGERGSRPTGCR